MADIYARQLEEYRQAWDPANFEKVIPSERFWAAHYEWLKTRGYVLRPRYSPDWVPSWRGTKKSPLSCEDGVASWLHDQMMDATRTLDGKHVVLKMIFKSQHPDEAEISLFLSREPLVSDPTNHCVPIYEVFDVPDWDDMVILVMPFLRPCDDPRFETFGEAVEFFRQVFEALQFLHKHHISHRDCSAQNIMMDATKLYPNGYHPVAIRETPNLRGFAKHYTRTERPPKYFLIDFGLSHRHDPKDGPPLELPIRGGDKSVPEFQGEKYDEPSNPFFTDIYYLGNMIKEDFMDVVFGFDFMSSLVADMVQDDPSKRPTIDQVMARYEEIYRSLSTSKLRSRMVQRKEQDPLRWWRNYVHFFRRVKFILLRIPPVPKNN